MGAWSSRCLQGTCTGTGKGTCTAIECVLLLAKVLAKVLTKLGSEPPHTGLDFDTTHLA
jgi:hypothetical protein